MHSPESLSLRQGWWADLAELHATPPRHYHTLDHVQQVAHNVLMMHEAGCWGSVDEPFVAALLHDAVYIAGASDNEAQSAALVRPWTATWVAGPLDVERVEALILATATHDATDEDMAQFLDCDLAILAADPPTFAAYEAGVRAEWEPVVGPEAYASGRRAFLEGLLRRPIFQSTWWRDRHEQAARDNVRRALETQASGSRRSPETSGTQ